jgi:soluble lytic murein transglycosylase
MLFFPYSSSFFQRNKSISLFAALLCALIGVSSQPRVETASAQSRASTQLRSAVAANSESDLQRVETSFAGAPEAALARFLRGYLRHQAKDYTTAASLLADQSIAGQTAIGDYALYYRAQALQESGRSEEAEREFRRLAQNYPTSALARTAILQAAGSAMLRGDYDSVIEDLAPLVDKNDGTALKLRADALEKLSRVNEAILTLRKLYYDAPQSAEADKAGARLTALGGSTAPADATQLKRRADNLFQAGLYAIAGQAYNQIAVQFPDAVTDETRLRAGISFYKANSFRESAAAMSQVRARTPKLMSDALYYLGMAQLSLNNESAAIQALADMRRAAPNNNRIGELLYGMGRYHEKRNRDEQASAYYSQLVRQFPESENAHEAHYWLAWRAHQAKDYATAAKMLTEHVANYGDVTDTRGKAAFWAAVDLERSGDKESAIMIYRAMLMRYGAGWYGVNAERRIARLVREGAQGNRSGSDPFMRRAVEGLQSIKLPQETLKQADAERVTKAEELMRVGFYQSAMNELDVARAGAPASPIVNLRIAQIFRLQGEPVAALNALKRAYPDYGQTLPEEMSREAWAVFYPLQYWSTITEESKRRGLDPYFIAGLIRQETVFDPKARSRANALGLMQLLPYVGRDVARRNGAGAITSNDLFNPVLNIQLGTTYVKELTNKFERMEYVAAAYNGGETRVRRWLRESPPAEIEEWVESIPLSETRLYVQGVYRNSRQYQRLYDENGKFRSSVPE